MSVRPIAGYWAPQTSEDFDGCLLLINVPHANWFGAFLCSKSNYHLFFRRKKKARLSFRKKEFSLVFTLPSSFPV
jgi:hypothetical protein